MTTLVFMLEKNFNFFFFFFTQLIELFHRTMGIISEITSGLIYQDLCPLTLPHIIYNNATVYRPKYVQMHFYIG